MRELSDSEIDAVAGGQIAESDEIVVTSERNRLPESGGSSGIAQSGPETITGFLGWMGGFAVGGG